METLHLYNTLTRSKQEFKALNPPFVGMYVCGPTVYSETHLGHARPAVVFDVLNRYLRHLGYKVRFVRNVTDVGHLENDSDDGEDKMLKKAKVMEMEPMQVAQHYLNLYHDDVGALNCLRPDMEPRATGHIPEQIELVEQLIKNGYAYEVDGSVYFDTEAYDKDFGYGALSGRKMEDLLAETRTLEGQKEKRRPQDFALWKAAPPKHIMRWKSPWGEGYPGWHLECTVMSTKYLGTKYDIHGGGLDLVFPHHEAEIAQSNGCIGDPCSHDLNEANFWVHNNMITVDQVKMARSKGNFISLAAAFSGDHERLSKAYSPTVIRFYILQSHYRSIVDFSDAALQGSEVAFGKLSDVYHRLQEINPSDFKGVQVNDAFEDNLASFEAQALGHLNDDINTCRAIARMFEAMPVINEIYSHRHQPLPVRPETFDAFKKSFEMVFTDILGLVPGDNGTVDSGKLSGVMEMVIALRKQVRANKNWPLADQIRDGLSDLNIKLKDTPSGTEWYVED